MQIIFTIAKLCLVTAIIIGGLVMIGQGETQNFENAFDGTSTSASAWAIAIYNGYFLKLKCNIAMKCLGMWSYDGWNQLNFVSQELKDPVRNFPIVICVGIPLGTD